MLVLGVMKIMMFDTIFCAQSRGDCSDWIGRELPTASTSAEIVYSQGSQDQILRSIFDFVGVTNRRAVEFGFGYVHPRFSGAQLLEHNSGLNTRLLREQGWNVTYFDALVEDQTVGIKK